MSYAHLREQGIDGADLDARSTAGVAEFSGSDMILTLRLKQRKRRESFDDQGACLGAGEALQEFLQDKACRYDDVCPQERLFELMDLRLRCKGVPSERKRPNACVDKERHVRDRSAL